MSEQNQERRGCPNCPHSNPPNADGSCSAYGYNGVDCSAQPCACRNHVVTERGPERHGSQFPPDSAIHVVADCARHLIAEYEASSVSDGDLFDLFRALMDAGYATPSVKAALNRTEQPQPPPEAAPEAEQGLYSAGNVYEGTKDFWPVEASAVAETPLTVEAALSELRKLFPFGVRGIEFWTVEDVERPRVDVRWDNKTVRGATLTEAMQKVREYAERMKPALTEPENRGPGLDTTMIGEESTF